MKEVDCRTKTTTGSSDACPTEDAIGALLEILVDPLLPFKTSAVPTKALRDSVAKQIYAVVLLYNYYHRREYPHLKSLSYESFRSLTTVMRPSLVEHFKESSEAGLNGDSEQTISLEKVIVDACSLSMSLDASSYLSSLKKWPIRKVAVLLVNFNKTTCFLQHSSITQGVWSLLEKTIKEEEPAGGNQKEEVVYQKAAFAAIKEFTGVNHNDIVILEKHLVCSLSEENTWAQFYIMKRISQEKFRIEIPIEEVLSCMQGPLFEKSFSEWATTTVVEYFHVLPYASLLEDWFSRRKDTEFVIEKESEAVCDDIVINGKADATKESEVSNTRRGESAAAKKSNKINAKKFAALLSNPRARRKATPTIQNQNLKEIAKDPNVNLKTVYALKANNGDNEIRPCKESYLNGEKGGLEVAFDSEDHKERGIQRKKAFADKVNSIDRLNAAPVSAHNTIINLEELHSSLLSKATSLSETALKVLLCKRDKLTLQQRYIEDEIAKCDKCIHNIQGNWKLQLETILECCNETYPRRIRQESPDKSVCQSNKRLKLSEPPLTPTKSLCQKLDDICLENNWVLPNYHVSPSDGGYEAEVRIKETNFAYAIRGEEKSDAEVARESAAVRLLAKLQHNATANFS